MYNTIQSILFAIILVGTAGAGVIFGLLVRSRHLARQRAKAAAAKRRVDLDMLMLRHGLSRGAYESNADASARLAYVITSRWEARRKAAAEAEMAFSRAHEAQLDACHMISVASGIEPSQLTPWFDGDSVHVVTPRALAHIDDVEDLACSAAGLPVRIHDTESRIPASSPPAPLFRTGDWPPAHSACDTEPQFPSLEPGDILEFRREQ
jgi:hypothetical protein